MANVVSLIVLASKSKAHFTGLAAERRFFYLLTERIAKKLNES